MLDSHTVNLNNKQRESGRLLINYSQQKETALYAISYYSIQFCSIS